MIEQYSMRGKIFRHMFGGSYGALSDSERKRTEKEVELTRCITCMDKQCPYRDKDERFPPDAEGKGQCLRWAEWAYQDNPYFWRNLNGDIIVIPLEIVEAIRDPSKKVDHSHGEESTIPDWALHGKIKLPPR